MQVTYGFPVGWRQSCSTGHCELMELPPSVTIRTTLCIIRVHCEGTLKLKQFLEHIHFLYLITLDVTMFQLPNSFFRQLKDSPNSTCPNPNGAFQALSVNLDLSLSSHSLLMAYPLFKETNLRVILDAQFLPPQTLVKTMIKSTACIFFFVTCHLPVYYHCPAGVILYFFHLCSQSVLFF